MCSVASLDSVEVHDVMTSDSPDEQAAEVGGMEQYQEAGGDAVVACQGNQGNGDDGKLAAVANYLPEDVEVTDFTMVQNHTIVIGAHDIANGVEGYHFPISTAKDRTCPQTWPKAIQTGEKGIHDEQVTKNDAKHQES